MDITIIIVCLGVGIAVGMYIASQIGDSIEAKVQTRDLVENLRRFDRKDIMDRREDEGDGDSQEDGNEGNNANSGEEHGVERKRTLNELRQTKSRYSNSNKGKKI